MQGSFRNKGVVVLLPKASGTVQCPSDDAYGLELGSRVADGFLVDGESLCKEFVSNLFESGLISYLSACDKEAKAEIRCTIASIQSRDG